MRGIPYTVRYVFINTVYVYVRDIFPYTLYAFCMYAGLPCRVQPYTVYRITFIVLYMYVQSSDILMEHLYTFPVN